MRLVLAFFIGFFFSLNKAQALESLYSKSCDQVSTPEINEAFLKDYHPQEQSNWFYPKDRPAKGVAMVVHGLNLRPSKMDMLARYFQEIGFEVRRVGLSGHRGSVDEFQNVSREIWLNDLYSEYCLVQKRAQELQVPIYYLGFSLGGVLALDLLHQTPHPFQIEKMILLAPALNSPWYTGPVHFFSSIIPALLIPSRNSAEYRANSGTPLAAYKALFDLIDSLKAQAYKKVSFPVLLMIDPEDELISLDKIYDSVKEFGLNKWEIVPIDNDDTSSFGKYHHLIVDQEAVGEAQWKKMLDKMNNFLGL